MCFKGFCQFAKDNACSFWRLKEADISHVWSFYSHRNAFSLYSGCSTQWFGCNVGNLGIEPALNVNYSVPVKPQTENEFYSH